ncbi:MAG: hypothetical protein OEX07_16330, partial [Gammaproteobacteria bacterium]|nr:hypothetical protein [Gammaproteobacteria bacterium]
PIAATIHDTTDITIVVDLNGESLCGTQSLTEKEIGQVTTQKDGMERFPSFFSKSRTPKQTNQSLFDVIINTMETMQNTISRLQLSVKTADVTIKIPVDTCSFYEFYRARELIDLGKQKAAEALSMNGINEFDNTLTYYDEYHETGHLQIPGSLTQH